MTHFNIIFFLFNIYNSPYLKLPPNLSYTNYIFPEYYINQISSNLFGPNPFSLNRPDFDIVNKSCIPCNFTFAENEKFISSKFSNNCLLSATFFGRLKNLVIFSKSARTCSNAIIYLFIDPIIDESIREKESYRQFLTNCQIFYHVISYPPGKSKIERPGEYRMFLFYHLLRILSKSPELNIEKVLFTDSRDAYFQSDPFDNNISKDTIVLQTECVTFGNSIPNKFWFNQMMIKPPFAFEEKRVINAGFFMGGVKVLERFFSLYLRFLNGLLDGREGLFDQVIINYLYYSNVLKLNDFDIVILTFPNTKYLSLTSCNVIANYQEGFIIKGFGRLSFVHQYDRDENWNNIVLHFCQNMSSEQIRFFNKKNSVNDQKKKKRRKNFLHNFEISF